MFKWCSVGAKAAELEEDIASLESENKILRQRYDSLNLQYLRVLREYRFSQKKNCRYKRHIKKLRQVMNQEEPKRITLKEAKKKIRRKIAVIIDDIKINQNYGKEEKKSSFIVTEDRNWHLSEEKIVAPDGYEHLPGNLIATAAHWLGLATERNWQWYDADGNAQDLQKIGEEYMKFLQKYFKV